MKILIVKTSALGDIIHTFPAISELRRRYPDAQIDFVVEEALSSLVKAHPFINTTITLNSKEWRKGSNISSFKRFIRCLRKDKYDLLFDLQGNIKSGLVTFFSRAKNKIGFGYKTAPEWPNTLFTKNRFNPPPGKNIREDYLAILEKFFQEKIHAAKERLILKISDHEKSEIELMATTCRAKIMVAPGSAWPNKRLPNADLQTFLHTFPKETLFYFIFGNEEEKRDVVELQHAFIDRAILVPKLSLPSLQNLMAKMDLVVAMDSLPLHLAATTGVSTFGFFGPSSAQKYAPSDRYVQGVCPYTVAFEKRCPQLRTCKTGACMKNFTFLK
ncbi:MAG: glycosyltransferase family 9 protein [Waddliaceae bacterium]